MGPTTCIRTRSSPNHEVTPHLVHIFTSKSGLQAPLLSISRHNWNPKQGVQHPKNSNSGSFALQMSDEESRFAVESLLLSAAESALTSEFAIGTAAVNY